MESASKDAEYMQLASGLLHTVKLKVLTEPISHLTLTFRAHGVWSTSLNPPPHRLRSRARMNRNANYTGTADCPLSMSDLNPFNHPVSRNSRRYRNSREDVMGRNFSTYRQLISQKSERLFISIGLRRSCRVRTPPGHSAYRQRVTYAQYKKCIRCYPDRSWNCFFHFLRLLTFTHISPRTILKNWNGIS